jgi:hypothetical protein
VTSSRERTPALDALAGLADDLRTVPWTMPTAAEAESRLGRPSAPPGETIGVVIARLIEDAESGAARDSSGRRYTRDSLRELRAALSHVDSELGALRPQALDSERIEGLLADLRRAGLSAGRLDSVVLALHRLHSYAGGSGQRAAVNFPDTSWPPSPVEEPPTAPPRQRTPTIEMLAAARRVAKWTVRTIVVLFALAIFVLIHEL